jgi:hypothetical protein
MKANVSQNGVGHLALDGMNGYLHDPINLPPMKQPSVLTEFEEKRWY